MEQPREFDPFMCMGNGGWARLGAWGGAQARGQDWGTAWPICQVRDFPGVALMKASHPLPLDLGKLVWWCWSGSWGSQSSRA